MTSRLFGIVGDLLLRWRESLREEHPTHKESIPYRDSRGSLRTNSPREDVHRTHPYSAYPLHPLTMNNNDRCWTQSTRALPMSMT